MSFDRGSIQDEAARFMMDGEPFLADGVTNVTLTSNGTSVRASIDAAKGQRQILLTNLSSVTGYFKTGDATVEATVNDTPILPSSAQSFTSSATHIAWISTEGTAVLVVTRSRGF